MVTGHNLGFPRIGVKRELKRVLEAYWRGELSQSDFLKQCAQIRAENWQHHSEAGLDTVPVGDFSWYDHVLDMSTLLGVIPSRFKDSEINLDTYFRMARGRAPQGQDVLACEMTKWFDTNYHYIVPEFTANQKFSIQSEKIFTEITEAQKLGFTPKPILLGPLSYLWLGKMKDSSICRLSLLPALTATYQEILKRMHDQGIDWVQMDEPILVLDLPFAWQQAFSETYKQFQMNQPKLLLTTYFGGLEDNLELACGLPVSGLHIDAVRAPHQIPAVMQNLSKDKILSLGVVDGRNIWRTDLQKTLSLLQPIAQQLGDRLWISASCSLLHVPVDLEVETSIDPELKNWLAFAKQKLQEIGVLTKALNGNEKSVAREISESTTAIQSKEKSAHTLNSKVRDRTRTINKSMSERAQPYATRRTSQRKILQLPLFPTTTIGSFPQTQEIRSLRSQLKSGKMTLKEYDSNIQQAIATAISWQEEIGIDVLVHGEFERNDMVEYFGENLAGFAITENGWVQSYGSRCVKPPIIYGDVFREKPLTTRWTGYAQSLTDKPVKGMLTGPNTILCWSFPRNDLARFETAKQIALALRDEVSDLENIGIKVIQIDEPAFREGLPLRRADWDEYFSCAIECFRLSSAGAKNSTQIHTHMCYSEFNDIIAAIANLDADVITIETSRSNMELLHAFEHFKYPNEIGPGVYDIHSPRIPTIKEIKQLIQEASKFIPKERLWINPDCGLKTRTWNEVKGALQHMVDAAQSLREMNHAVAEVD